MQYYSKINMYISMFERNYVTFNSTGNSVLFQQQIHHVFLRLSNIVYTDKVKSRESTFSGSLTTTIILLRLSNNTQL